MTYRHVVKIEEVGRMVPFCDACEAEIDYKIGIMTLTIPPVVEDYRLVSEEKRIEFCNLSCLCKWVKKHAEKRK